MTSQTTLGPANDGSDLTTSMAGEENEDSSMVMREPWLMSMFVFSYSLIFLLGMTGNCLVAFVVMRNKAMQTITNIFITNLAISDILMCALAVPFTPLAFFLNSWVFGPELCHLLSMVSQVFAVCFLWNNI